MDPPLLPEKSKNKYEAIYKAFMEWQNSKDVQSFSEDVLLDYFEELSEKYKSTSLWTHYSMLRSTLNINHNVNIEHYRELRAFLKRTSEGYQAKKTKTFTVDEINEFINIAPDDKFLVTKVVLIVGVTGACRTNELHALTTNDVRDLGSELLITLPKSKLRKIRKFTITGQFYDICKKYVDLRPDNVTVNSFFLTYHNGKCIAQKIGINKFGSMGKTIATYLKLPNPEMYTGHCFRKSSPLTRKDEWNSASSAEEDSNDSMNNRINTMNQILQSVKQGTTVYTQNISSTNESINVDLNAMPSLTFNNCSNLTINIIVTEKG